ncbi:MAG: hypothetical protein KJ874_03690 [Acidobacteria bacterium]|nr:hypothetical protein [Acidobacteriota bacterium]
MRRTFFPLVIFLAFTTFLSAQETAQNHVQAQELNITLYRDAITEIDRQYHINRNKLRDETYYWTLAEVWNQEVFQSVESGHLAELTILEAKLTAAGNLSADGKVYIPGYGITTQKVLALAVQEKRTQISLAKQTYNASNYAVYIPGIGNITMGDIIKKISDTRKQGIDYGKALSDGKLVISYPHLGNITREILAAKITSEQGYIKGIRDEVTAGKYVFHSPHLGNTNFSIIDDAIKKAEEELARLAASYADGTLVIYRHPYGAVNLNIVRDRIAAKNKEISDLETQIRDGKLAVSFGAGMISNETATAKINAMKASLDPVELTISRGTYPVRLAIFGMRDRNFMQAALKSKGGYSVPQLAAVRNGINHLGRFAGADLANRKADILLWEDWRRAIPSAANYRLQYLATELSLLKSLGKEFLDVYNDNRVVINKKIARLKQSKFLKYFKSIVLSPYNDNVLIYEKEKLEIAHHGSFVNKYYQSFITLKETTGKATFKIVADNYIKELNRQRSFWSRAGNVATILNIGDGTAMVPVLGTATVQAHQANCQPRVRTLLQQIEGVRHGDQRLYVLGINSVPSRKELDAQIDLDKRNLAKLNATINAGDFHVVLPLGAATRNNVQKAIDDNKQIIYDKTNEMSSGDFAVVLPVIGRTSKNLLNEMIAAEGSKRDTWIDDIENGRLKIYRGGWWFTKTELENAIQVKNKEIADIDSQLAAGTFVGSFTVRMNGQQIEAALKDLDAKANAISQAVSSKTYVVRMPQNNTDISLQQAEQALANPNISSPDRAYYQQALAFVSSASALELRVIDLERNKFNLWKSDIVKQADYQKARINLDLNYYKVLDRRELSIEIKNGKAHWDRRINWLGRYLPFLPLG